MSAPKDFDATELVPLLQMYAMSWTDGDRIALLRAGCTALDFAVRLIEAGNAMPVWTSDADRDAVRALRREFQAALERWRSGRADPTVDGSEPILSLGAAFGIPDHGDAPGRESGLELRDGVTWNRGLLIWCDVLTLRRENPRLSATQACRRVAERHILGYEAIRKLYRRQCDLIIPHGVLEMTQKKIPVDAALEAVAERYALKLPEARRVWERSQKPIP